MVSAGRATTADESPEAVTDALLSASRLLIAISARAIAAHRRDEIARIADSMPAAQRRGLARTLTKAGGEPPAGHDIDAS